VSSAAGFGLLVRCSCWDWSAASCTVYSGDYDLTVPRAWCYGAGGLVSRKRGRPSNRRFSEAFREQVVSAAAADDRRRPVEGQRRQRLGAALAMAQALQSAKPHNWQRNNNAPIRSSQSVSVFATSRVVLDEDRLGSEHLKRRDDRH